MPGGAGFDVARAGRHHPSTRSVCWVMDKDLRKELSERSLGALGWFNLAMSNLAAADFLESEKAKELPFHDPIRGLYAHAWELVLKACLRSQGLGVDEIRSKFGHDLRAIWDAVDRPRFPLLQLRDELDTFIDHLGFYHQNRLYAYPLAGSKRELELSFLRATSSRLRMSRSDAASIFPAS